MPRLMEIRKQHGFPQPFGKASQKTLCFTTFSTASTAGSHSTRFRPSLYADNSVLNFWEKSPVGRAHSTGWCYPSVAHRRGVLNAAFVQSKAKGLLDVVAVVAAETLKRRDCYEVRFIEVGTVETNGTISYTPYDYEAHKHLIPNYELPSIADF